MDSKEIKQVLIRMPIEDYRRMQEAMAKTMTFSVQAIVKKAVSEYVAKVLAKS